MWISREIETFVSFFDCNVLLLVIVGIVFLTKIKSDGENKQIFHKWLISNLFLLFIFDTNEDMFNETKFNLVHFTVTLTLQKFIDIVKEILTKSFVKTQSLYMNNSMTYMDFFYNLIMNFLKCQTFGYMYFQRRDWNLSDFIKKILICLI